MLESMASNSRFRKLSIVRIQGEMGNTIPETTNNQKSPHDKYFNFPECNSLLNAQQIEGMKY